MLRTYYLLIAAAAIFFQVSNAKASLEAEGQAIRPSTKASKEIDKDILRTTMLRDDVGDKLNVKSNRFKRDKGHLEIQHFTSPKELLDIFFINRDVTTLNLDFTDFTDQVAGYLHTYCKALESINASRTCLTDQGVMALFEAYQAQLISLDLSMVALTDLSMKSMALHGKGLKSLKISDSPEITENGIRELLTGCTALNSLSIVKCGVSDVRLSELRRIYPNVVIENRAKVETKEKNYKKNHKKGKNKKPVSQKSSQPKQNQGKNERKREALRKLLEPALKME